MAHGQIPSTIRGEAISPLEGLIDSNGELLIIPQDHVNIANHAN